MAPIAVLAIAALGLAACGFTPLYADRAGVVTKLSKIDVVAPQGRTGFLIRQHLDDYLTKDRDAAPAYRMTLQLAETRFPRGVRVDNVATRYEYVLTAAYQLTSLPSGDTAKAGSVHVELTYDSADQPYAAVSAQQDAQDRAAEEAARRIQLEIAAWLATGKPELKKAGGRRHGAPIEPPDPYVAPPAPLALPSPTAGA
ncbi:MAG TPA: LPS assembly lipoprotein LptE [Phenylobacterium sp.]|nr:LPS assembly lipoprotein LptE [Phenylobacterium sp.]